MISLRKQDKKEREGFFRSYRAIGEYLVENGETGIYYAIPRNIKSTAGMKEIKVEKYWDDDLKRWEREIEMEGSYY